MIKTIKILFFSILIISNVHTQDLEISSKGNVYLAENSYLTTNSITVKSGGNVLLNSNATNSSSLLIKGTAIGNITYNRFLDSANWYLISAPITMQSVSSFVSANAAILNTNGTKSALGVYISENPATTKWSYYDTINMPTDLTGNFISGQGYTVNRNTAGTIAFTGTIATTDVTIPLITNSGTHFWHSVGNPFPSFLPGNTAAGTVNILEQNSTNLNPLFSFLYVFDGTNYKPIAIDDVAFHIAPGQAFMVNPKSNNEVFTFSEALTNHQTETTTFYKTTKSESRLKITMNDGFTEKDTTIRYLANGTNGLDVGYDAGAYQTGIPKYALNTRLVDNSYDVDFTIQVLSNENIYNSIIPLSVYAETNKNLSFNVILENLPKETYIFLEDKELSIIKDITSNSYQLKVEKKLNGIGRFYIHASPKSVLSLEEIKLSSINIFANGQNELVLNGFTKGNKVQFSLYSVLGKELKKTNFNVNGEQRIKLPKNITKGVYIAKILVNGTFISKKIILN